jgi:hypothetical protein
MGRLAAAVGAALVCACLSLLSIPAHGSTDAFPAVRGNPADRLVQVPIEDYRYDFARHCTRRARPGTLALQAWLGRHFRGISWGILHCEKLRKHEYSLHAEGRALDWHLDVRNSADRADAERLIGVLLAPDRLGNPHALARRMGVQEIIWSCHAWWSGADAMTKYRECFNRHGKRRHHVDPTLAHRDHVHIGLNRMGAAKLTSFWEAGIR